MNGVTRPTERYPISLHCGHIPYMVGDRARYHIDGKNYYPYLFEDMHGIFDDKHQVDRHIFIVNEDRDYQVLFTPPTPELNLKEMFEEFERVYSEFLSKREDYKVVFWDRLPEVIKKLESDDKYSYRIAARLKLL